MRTQPNRITAAEMARRVNRKAQLNGIIGASVAETRQAKASAAQLQARKNWGRRGVIQPRRYRKAEHRNEPGDSWWCHLEPSAFYATARERDQIRQQQMSHHAALFPASAHSGNLQ